MTLLIASALLGTGAALFVVWPLLARRVAMLADVEPGEVLDAEARKRVSLAALKELEYDFLGGKLDEPDYRAQRDLLSREALEAVREAERVQRVFAGGRSADAADAAPGADVPAVAVDSVAEAAPEGEVRHTCGFLNPAASRFCAGCGARLR